MAKYAEIECFEEHAKLNESVTRDQGMEAQVILRCTWANRFPLMQELLGPLAYPYPNTPVGWTKPWPINVSCAPDPTKYTTDVDEQVITYEDALITVQYGYIDVDVTTQDPDDPDPEDPKTIVNESLEPTTEFLTSDYKDFLWGDQDTGEFEPIEEDEAPGKLFRSFNLVRQYFSIKRINGTALTLPGHVNREIYTSRILGFTFPAETLLFMPPSMQRTFTTDGTKGWNLTVRFAYKPQTWNKYWRVKSDEWEFMFRNNAIGTDLTYRAYPLGDFSAWLA